MSAFRPAHVSPITHGALLAWRLLHQNLQTYPRKERARVPPSHMITLCEMLASANQFPPRLPASECWGPAANMSPSSLRSLTAKGPRISFHTHLWGSSGLPMNLTPTPLSWIIAAVFPYYPKACSLLPTLASKPLTEEVRGPNPCSTLLFLSPVIQRWQRKQSARRWVESLACVWTP